VEGGAAAEDCDVGRVCADELAGRVEDLDAHDRAIDRSAFLVDQANGEVGTAMTSRPRRWRLAVIAAETL
jgi:hypothetical protein